GLSAHHRGGQLPGYCPAHQPGARMVFVGRLRKMGMRKGQGWGHHDGGMQRKG
ncbi:hypothetical protein RCH06_003582, partial [Polaromonas sp. CG_9.5]|nr:hypothetical protein [Polaromonas sp. CG_9.5]